MPRSGTKRPLFPGMYTRHLDEMRKLLHVLDPHALPEYDGGMTVPMDSYETETALVLELDLPGVEVSAINLVQRGQLVQIEVEKQTDVPSEEARYICLERHFGRFRRTVHLPDNVDGSQLKAEYRCGVLRITCPKGHERRILIKESGCE